MLDYRKLKRFTTSVDVLQFEHIFNAFIRLSLIAYSVRKIIETLRPFLFFFRAAFDELSLLYVIDLSGFIHAAIFPLNFLGSLNLRLNKFSQTKSNQSVNNNDRHFYPEYLTERRLECYAQTLKYFKIKTLSTHFRGNIFPLCTNDTMSRWQFCHSLKSPQDIAFIWFGKSLI